VNPIGRGAETWSSPSTTSLAIAPASGANGMGVAVGPAGAGRAGTRMRLAVAGPSRGWRTWASGALEEADLDGALLLTLEVGQHWLKQKGLRGDKVVELGTGHTAQLPWLTSLETPVTVLQLTGALVDREGRVVRIGAEGLLARRTAFRLSVIGAQELVTNEDVERLRESRREDLPGHPLVWQAALHHLMEQLTGKSP
jgi:hypothetical protein